MIKPWLTVLLLCVTLFGQSGCTFTPRETSPKNKPANLRWAIASAPETLDWTLCASAQCLHQAGLVMEGLTAVSSVDYDLKAIPMLAASWISPSATEIIFTLKPNVTWSDGQPLRASDFLQAWKRLLSPSVHAPFAHLLFNVVNAKAYHEGHVLFNQVGVRALDDLTLSVRLHSPSATFPFVVSHPATWPIRTTKVITASPSPTLGPFVLDKTNGSSLWRYVRSSKYHGPPPGLDSLEIKYVPHDSARIDQFMSGETDFVDEVPDALLPPIEQIPGLVSEPTNSVIALVFNTSRKLFATSEVRQAFQAAINPDELSRLVGHHDLPASRLFPVNPTASGWTPPFSAASAKRLVQPFTVESSSQPRAPLAPGTKNGLHPTLTWNRNNVPAEFAENLQAQILKNLDIRLELVPADAVASDESGFGTASSALYLVSLSASPLPSTGPLDIFTSSHAPNPTRWKNKTFDTLLTKAQLAATSTLWQSFLLQAQELLIAKEAVVMPLAFRARNVLKGPQIKSLGQNPIEIWDFRDTTM